MRSNLCVSSRLVRALALARAAAPTVDKSAAYETRPAAAETLVELVESGAVDTVLFTSSSTVMATVERLGSRAVELLRRLTVASIGPVTTKTAEELGVHVDVTAAIFTVDGLLDALEEHCRAHA